MTRSMQGLAFLLLLLAVPAHAQDAERINAFNEAWQAYVDAKESGQVQATVDASAEVLEIGKEILPADDKRLPFLMMNHGKALVLAKRTADGRKLLKNSVELAQSIYGEDSVETVPMLSNYGAALAEYQQPAMLRRQYEKALEILQANYGKNSMEYADMLLEMGIGVVDLSRSTRGKKHLRDARSIYEKIGGEDRSGVGISSFYIGKAEMADRDYKRATENFELALDNFDKEGPRGRELRLITHAFLVRAYEMRGLSDRATEHCVAIGAESPVDGDEDYIPLFRRAPTYPGAMLSSGIEGHVDISFTVDAQGFVRDPVVLDREGGHAFEKAAIDAVMAFRYAPKFEDGEPVATTDVKTRITFKLD